MQANTILARAENTTFEVVAGEAILIDLNTGTYFSLNKVGTEFWVLLDGEQTVAQHAETIAARYGVDAAIVQADLLELADKMAADHLVVAAP